MEIYHVISRGVDKRNIFLDRRDYFRFVHNLYEFNDQNWVINSAYPIKSKIIDLASRYYREKPRELLVQVHAFCLMPNHFHLLLSPVVDNGVSRFMRKINMGYAKYFNIKNDRVGALFQSRYKSISVEKDSHFTYLPYYIHLNPLDLYMPEWRDGKLRSVSNAIKYLEQYQWSSLSDYLGQDNFSSILHKDFLLEVFGGIKGYKSAFQDYLKDLNLEKVKDIILE